MLVAKYWAEIRLQHKVEGVRAKTKGQQITIRRLGWSDESQEAAQTHAQMRAQEALQDILDHPDQASLIQRYEKVKGYNGADGFPIREEVVMTQGDDIAITRNSYGALCLNTPNVMFVDIDNDTYWSSINPFNAKRHQSFVWMPLFLFITLFATLYMAIGWGLLTTLSVSSIGALAISYAWNHIYNRLYPPEKQVDTFAKENPHWRFNLYRTAAGYRLLILHQLVDPSDEKIWSTLSRLGVDPIYLRMCRLQKCFRARLTPKPWRMQLTWLDCIPGGRKPWQSTDATNPERLAWVKEYERDSVKYAVCELIHQYGDQNTPIDPKIKEVLDLHDQYTKVSQTLPLA